MHVREKHLFCVPKPTASHRAVFEEKFAVFGRTLQAWQARSARLLILLKNGNKGCNAALYFFKIY